MEHDEEEEKEAEVMLEEKEAEVIPKGKRKRIQDVRKERQDKARQEEERAARREENQGQERTESQSGGLLQHNLCSRMLFTLLNMRVAKVCMLVLHFDANFDSQFCLKPNIACQFYIDAKIAC